MGALATGPVCRRPQVVLRGDHRGPVPGRRPSPAVLGAPATRRPVIRPARRGVYASRLQNKISPAASAMAAYPQNTANPVHGANISPPVPIGDGEVECGGWAAVQICAPAAVGSHLLRWFCQLYGSRFPSSGSTNSTATMAVSAPAVCRISSPMPRASSPPTVRNSAPPMTARSTPGWLSVVLVWCDDMIAWPMKNDAKLLMRPVTNATAASTATFAAASRPRCGSAVSEVRIIPVEYSEVMTSVPTTPISSWVSHTPPRLQDAGSQNGPW